MKLQIEMNASRVLALLLISSAVYGCASNGSLIAMNHFSIDRLASENAAIEKVQIRTTETGINIAGTVRFSQRRIGTPPGYLDVTIISPGGKVLYTTHCAYYRYGRPIRPSATFNFAALIPLPPPPGSTVRLAPRDAS